jgi:phosphoribosyl 1,2-cyclic phosphodiesterase
LNNDMRVTSLASGSSGNALLIEAGPQQRTKLLVDVGLPARILSERLRRRGTDLSQLSGILITHEHSDHISGLPVLVRRSTMPIISAPETFSAIAQCFAAHADQNPDGAYMIGDEGAAAPRMSVAETISKVASPMAVGSQRIVGDIEIASFPVSHDAVAPCGYLLSAGGCRICIAIDSGEVTSTMLEAIYRADLLVLESNHDRQRLLRGPYPYYLKQRILSSTGHLSNDQAADAVLQTWRSDSVRWLWLSHLSRTNNTPKLALNNMLSRLEAVKVNRSQLHISILPPGMGQSWDSTRLWHEPSLWDFEYCEAARY